MYVKKQFLPLIFCNQILYLWVLFIQLLCKKCPYSELLCSVFSCIQTEYREIQSISPYSVQMRENADQNNSKYGHFLHSEFYSVLFGFFRNIYRSLKVVCKPMSMYVSCMQNLFDVNEKKCTQIISFLQDKIIVCSLNPPYFFKCCTKLDCLYFDATHILS